jgi:hypothetical protein
MIAADKSPPERAIMSQNIKQENHVVKVEISGATSLISAADIK